MRIRRRAAMGRAADRDAVERMAFDAGAMVVNSSRNGGGKDTWVLE